MLQQLELHVSIRRLSNLWIKQGERINYELSIHMRVAFFYFEASCIGSSFNFDDFFSWQNHMDYLSCLCDKFPDRAQTIDIGKSVEGRALRVIKIGRPRPDGMAKPAIWIDGGTHAREWISPAAVEYLVNQLVQNSASIEINTLVDNFDIYVLPILNPDGFDLK